MNFPCWVADGIVDLEDCIPTCTRWSKVNYSDTIKVFVDAPDYPQGAYVSTQNVTALGYQGVITMDDNWVALGAQQHVQVALDIWNDAYTCGNLFEMVTDISQADVVVTWIVDDNLPSQGVVDCACEAEGDAFPDCSVNVDHGDFFGPANPHNMRIYHMSTNGVPNPFSWQATLDTVVHEFGHVLGMGHNFDQSITTIMGFLTNAQRPNRGQLYDYDVDELNARYPCGCNVVEMLGNYLDSEIVIGQSSQHCGGCK